MPTPTVIHPTGTPESKFPRITLTVYVARYLGETEGEPVWDDEAAEARMVVESVVWGSRGELSTAAIRYELGGSPDGEDGEAHVHEAGVRLLHGAKVRLVDDNAAPAEEWFRGYLGFEEVLVQASPDRETYRLTAYGPELALRNKDVTGQWFAKNAVDAEEIAGTAADEDRVRANAFRSYVPAVFNACRSEEDAANLRGANASGTGWYLADDAADAGCFVFVAPGRKVINGLLTFEATPWTIYAAARSLVEWIDNYETISYDNTDWTAIAAILNAKVLRTTSVDTLSLLDALRAVLLPNGYGFAVEPWAGADGKHALLIDSLKAPATLVYPNLAPLSTKMTSAAGKAAEVQRLHFALDSHNIRNNVQVLGDYRRAQMILVFKADASTRDLWPAWDTVAEDLADFAATGVMKGPLGISATQLSDTALALFGDYYNPHGSEHGAHQHAFRSFCWNEDGSFSAYVKDETGPILPDLYADYGIGFGAGEFSRRPRPMGPLYEYDDASKVKSPAAQVWMVEPVSGAKVKIEKVHVWDDFCGFTITEEFWSYSNGVPWRPFAESTDALCPDALREETYLQLLLNTLTNAETGYKIELRLCGTIEDDVCVSAISSRSAGSPWPLLADRTVRDAERFKLREVDDGLGGSTDTVDDTTAAMSLAVQIRDAEEDQLGHGSIILPFVTCAYKPGDGVPATAGRVIDLSVDGGAMNYQPVIRQVRWTFGEGPQMTELVLDSILVRIGR